MGYLGYKPADKPLTAADITDSIITSAKIVDGTIVNADINASAAIAGTKLSGITFPLAFKNGIINGDFSIAQRGTSFTSSANNDDVYTLDRWYILSDGNDAIDVTQETTTVPTNQLTAIALDVETANKKFGIAQIIEQKNCVGLIGNTVTLSFKAKVSATTKLDNVKCAIVAWSGTADTVTSDIISAWGVEGTNPTLIANATYENTPANLNVTTSYATYSVSAAVDTSSTKNIIVFIWSDVTDTTAGDFLYITDVQLEKGSAASDFEFLPIDVSLGRCERYFQTTGFGNIAIAESGTVYVMNLVHRQTMRTVPSKGLMVTSNIVVTQFGVADRTSASPSVFSSTGSKNGSHLKIDGFGAIGSASTPAGIAYTSTLTDGDLFKLDAEL